MKQLGEMEMARKYTFDECRRIKKFFFMNEEGEKFGRGGKNFCCLNVLLLRANNVTAQAKPNKIFRVPYFELVIRSKRNLCKTHFTKREIKRSPSKDQVEPNL